MTDKSILKRSFIAAFFILSAAISFQTVIAEEASWKSLVGEVDTERDAVGGEWKIEGDTLSVSAATSARLLLPAPPTTEYDLRVSFTRQSGQHSIGAIIVHSERQVAFELDAWGDHLAGFQNIGGKTIQNNPSRRNNIRLENGKRYSFTIEVRRDSIRALLDEKEISMYQTDGHDLSLSDFWTMPNKNQLGLIAWESATDFHEVTVRTAGKEPTRASNDKRAAGSKSDRTSQSVASMKSDTDRAPGARVNSERRPTGKRVLIVIANNDFFYREYAEPRKELEQRGIEVVVASGNKRASRPHPNSGQDKGDGTVTPDVALKDVKAKDYDAILFSGGWGASMYQYAFPGRYDNQMYNGDKSTKDDVNRIITDFAKQDKYLCALCNGVSVLAWARVEGRSPLDSKRVCSPAREAPAGIYQSRHAQPPCSWHAEQNGAKVSPFQSIGKPNSSDDDVIVDGKIITGEDDSSAAEMGRKIAEVLIKK